MDKKEIYFVIVNLENLKFEDDGEDVSFIENAEHFDTLEEAKEKLEEYDDDFKGGIYKVSTILNFKRRNYSGRDKSWRVCEKFSKRRNIKSFRSF